MPPSPPPRPALYPRSTDQQQAAELQQALHRYRVQYDQIRGLTPPRVPEVQTWSFASDDGISMLMEPTIAAGRPAVTPRESPTMPSLLSSGLMTAHGLVNHVELGRRGAIGTIFQYSEKAPRWTGSWTMKHERLSPNTRLFGVELETLVRNRDVHATAREVYAALNPFALLKADGSIGSSGFEIVSAPATFQVHRKAWTKFFFGTDDQSVWSKFLYSDKDNRPKIVGPAQFLSSYHTTTCGMHVHVSTKGIPSVLQLGRLWSFINTYEMDKYISRIAGRTISRNESGNSYCLQRNPKITAAFNPSGAFAPGRYSALNLSPQETVEFRIFRGNTHPVGFMKNLDFCDSVIEFCGQHNSSQISGANYVAWVASPGVAPFYPFINAWMRRHKVHLMRESGAPPTLNFKAEKKPKTPTEISEEI